MSLVERIVAHAERGPRRAAIIYNGRTVTYARFANAIAGVRAYLGQHDLRPGQYAVLCLNGALEGWIVALALRSLGLTTVHAQSLADIAALGLEPHVLIASEPNDWAGLEAAAAHAPLITVPRSAYVAVKAEAPARLATAPFGGHILLTSGTTGDVKKVLVGAQSDHWNQTLRAQLYGFSPASIVSVFDFAAWTSVGYHLPSCLWTLGASVVIHQGAERWRALLTPGLTLAYTHPQALADILAAPANAYARNDAMTLIVTSGALSVSLWQAARARLTDDVRTCIGATEAGVVTITPIRSPEDLAWHRIHPACAVEVVDEADQIAPTGVLGALRVKAHGLDGYLHDAAASGRFFKAGYFYTGDLAVRRADGRVSLQGRVTDVINIMGDKLAAGPIERGLEAALDLAAACVFSTPGPDGETVHVVLQTQQSPPPEALTRALRALLPGLTHVRVHTLDALPRNQTGKIDRTSLRAKLAARA